MAKLTLVLAVLLVALGLTGYLGTGSLHPTALIPAAFGILLAILVALIYSRVFGGFLAVFGFLGFVAELVNRHPIVLAEVIFSLLLLGIGVAGVILPMEGRRKLFMHINVTIALLGFIGSTSEAIRGYFHAKSLGVAPDQIALASKVTLAALLLIYVILCVRSFIAVRRSGKV